MSSDTWTLKGVLSNSELFDEAMWRVVNKEGRSSSAKVVDTADEVEALEELVYLSKANPKINAQRLHQLLITPFETADPKHPSRFRGPRDQGVLYAADSFECAATEKAYQQILFLKSSPELDRIRTIAHTALEIAINTNVVDVRLKPYDKDAAIFTNKNSYEKTQEFGRIARKAGIGGIIYKSVRMTKSARCIAVLKPSAIAKRNPISSDDNWELTVQGNTALWINTGSLNPPSTITITFSDM